MYSDDNKVIGMRIKEARLKAGLTQEVLAEIADLSVQHLSKVENGHKGLNLATTIRIANALDISIDFLVHEWMNDMNKVFLAEIERLIDGCTDDELIKLIMLLQTGKEIIKK